ncbi:mannose-6-phosphate isomerase, class I [Streptococcus macacae]|uniref:Mannose-6-phosphate isomerase n=1 Tax=Streptococcus macacae NCTC 11558 TaxID=764298 RepID=G5JXE1_9STRE|nr:mannose-6-phosphate isomerase, class I [Streptococcus macacae]EHJ52511.1 putative phosphomannose isomerase type I [Streptococcus macacae NCTC 11558]SUN79196.1 mannose-6-phosphate isomerase [Streptococcus macacae NCTC 11558]
MAEPLFLQSQMHEKIWGGDHLKTEFGYSIPSETTGEYWAISAHPNGVSVIKNGSYKGMPLDKLYAEHRELFANSSSPVFPLLTKILDANDWLSVQVHPDDTYALEHEGELGKTECWYIIAAEEGAEIIYGHHAKSKEELRQMIAAGQWDSLLTKVAVKAGDFFYVPSGTMHAIGKGIMVLETQQSSDTTYRVYDFDRKDSSGQKRELHIEQSIDVLTIGKPANSVPADLSLEQLESTLLVSSPFFTVYKWQIKDEIKMYRTFPYLLVSILDGAGSITVDRQHYDLKKGDHFILPADVNEWEFTGDLTAIASYPNEHH